MGLPLTKVGDSTFGTGTHGLKCCPHAFSGSIIQGSENVNVNGSPVVRVQDMSFHSCPHCGLGMVQNGSPTINSNTKQVARQGDQMNEICGTGTIISGSSNLNAG